MEWKGNCCTLTVVSESRGNKTKFIPWHIIYRWILGLWLLVSWILLSVRKSPNMTKSPSSTSTASSAYQTCVFGFPPNTSSTDFGTDLSKHLPWVSPHRSQPHPLSLTPKIWKDLPADSCCLSGITSLPLLCFFSYPSQGGALCLLPDLSYRHPLISDSPAFLHWAVSQSHAYRPYQNIPVPWATRAMRESCHTSVVTVCQIRRAFATTTLIFPWRAFHVGGALHLLSNAPSLSSPSISRRGAGTNWGVRLSGKINNANNPAVCLLWWMGLMMTVQPNASSSLWLRLSRQLQGQHRACRQSWGTKQEPAAACTPFSTQLDPHTQ